MTFNLPRTYFFVGQVSYYALRVAVGMVSHVDLPLDNLMAALTMSASAEVLAAMGTSISISGLTKATRLPDESNGVLEQGEQHRLQKQGYAALCEFMQKLETPPATLCCGIRGRCSTCGSTQRNNCYCVSWRDEMVRVRNGKGGLVWVKKANEAAYKEKICREADWSVVSTDA